MENPVRKVKGEATKNYLFLDQPNMSACNLKYLNLLPFKKNLMLTSLQKHNSKSDRKTFIYLL